MANDPKDRHVLATAIVAGARVVVTNNLKDFKVEAVVPYGMEAISPDQFLIHQFDLNPAVMIELLEEQAGDCTRPPLSLYELLQRLGRVVPEFVSVIRVHL